MSNSLRRFLIGATLAAGAVLAAACGPGPAGTAEPTAVAGPIAVKLVVVTMFEIGEDTGDQAAEFQL